MNIKTMLKSAAAAAITLCCVTPAYAVIACPDQLTHTNPDGSTLQIMLHGDENFNYTTTADGHLVAMGSDKMFHFATVVNGRAIATDMVATDMADRSADVVARLSALDTPAMIEQLKAGAGVSHDGPMMSWSNPVAEKRTNFPTIGSPRVLVLLVQYPDYKFEYSKTQFENWLNQKGYNYNTGNGAATGSVRDYYSAASNGQFTPQFDVYGPVTAPYERVYYGNDSYSDKTRVTALVRYACEQLDSQINYADYDNNNDGEVDIVYMVYAGSGAADTGDGTAIWPHKWYLSSRSNAITLDGKYISLYGCSPELSYGKYFTAIGTFSHEFGHCLGLPDLYDTAGCGYQNPGHWDIMASGNYNNQGKTPPLMSAYERSVLGWLTPTRYTEAKNVILGPSCNPTSGYNDVQVIPSPTNANEYFLIENRQNISWDSALPGHGLLIWHVDYNSSIWSANKVNCYEHQYVDIEEACGPGNSVEANFTYPGNSKNRSFTDDTTPSMLTWAGAAMNSPITRITEASDGVISFDFKGGVPVASKLELNPTVTAYNQATLSWKPVSGISEYIVTVKDAVTGKVITNEAAVTSTSLTLAGLNPLTKYDFTVSYYSDHVWSDKSGDFTTDNTPLNMRAPENVVTTEVGDTYFITEWDHMDMADHYSVTVYTGSVGDAITVTEKFDDSRLLEGWSTDATKFVTAAGYYGTSAPSLQLATSQSVISTIYPGCITKLQFYTRRIGSVNGKFTIYGRSSSTAAWIEIDTKTAASSKARQTINIEPADNIHQIKFIMTTEEAEAMIDDIALDLDSSIDLVPVEGFEIVDAGTTPTHRVHGLQYDTEYFYTVRGHNDDHDSLHSYPVAVKTDVFTGIDNLVADGDESGITVDGDIITVTTAIDAIVSAYTPGGAAVIRPVKVGAGSHAFQLPDRGIYLVKVGTKTYKVAL